MGRPARRTLELADDATAQVFNHLSFSELFDLGDLWHESRALNRSMATIPPRGAPRYKARLWDEFNYYGLQDSLAERWAQLYGLVQAKSHSSRRLFASSSIGNGAHEDNHPPCCDHTTLWRRKGRQARFSEVLVTQPYSYDLDKMVAFAKKHFLWFWISERPAWHCPRGVFFIEWARPESQFTMQREHRKLICACGQFTLGRRKSSFQGQGARSR
jgi:hypothetical protein